MATANHIISLLQQAVSLQQQGHFGRAEILYLQVLQAQPDNFDAMHLLGVVARQTGRPELALELISRAISINPLQANAHCNAGAALQDLERPQEALASYEQALKLQPGYALALNNRGNALRRLARHEEALESYQQAVAAKPAYAEAHNNLGAALHTLHRYEEALRSYEQALQLNPKFADALNKLGITLHALHDFDGAVESYDRVLQLQPAHADAWCNRGMALQKLQYVEDAIDSYDRALGIKPEFAQAHLGRANSLRSLQRNDEAIAAYMQAMECGSDAEQVNYALAALGVVAAPTASPGAYVRELFDQYAGHFDDHLQQNLQYRTPALLMELLAPHLPAGRLDIADLGCGTGLCGALLKPYARTLDGIDMSPAMLEQAKQKDIYDSLVCADIEESLSQSPQRYDVAVAADVFVYIGDLSGIFSAAAKALKTGGFLAFSIEEVEEAEQQDIVLRASRRFAHSLAYLHKTAAAHGFAIDEMARQVIRQDDGADLHGYLAIMRRL